MFRLKGNCYIRGNNFHNCSLGIYINKINCEILPTVETIFLSNIFEVTDFIILVIPPHGQSYHHPLTWCNYQARVTSIYIRDTSVCIRVTSIYIRDTSVYIRVTSV